MDIAIVGWYGTETLGDIAILDGILEIISRIDPKCIVRLGTLYQFHTRRTFLENQDLIQTSYSQIELSLFNLRDKTEIENNIKNSDYLIMGGGPLMNISEMHIIRYCFEYASQRGAKCIIAGCGIGPISEEYIGVLNDIMSKTTAIGLRDAYSVRYAQKMGFSNVEMIDDPAIDSINRYRLHHIRKGKDYVAINVREVNPKEYGCKKDYSLNNYLRIVKQVAKLEKEIKLVPMHTFDIGGDDREILVQIANSLKEYPIEVIHKPLSLTETYEIYQNAYACVGMRYHSVVFQTLLNGNNCIINYTDNDCGKIRGFVDRVGFTPARVWNMDTEIDNEWFENLNNTTYESYKLNTKCFEFLKHYLRE